MLVTGGAGYIGSVLVGDLLSSGYQVTVLDNFMYGINSLGAYCWNKNFNAIVGDIRDDKLVKVALKSADIIIPLAAIVGAPACDKDPLLSTSTNKDAILRMFSMVSNEQLVLMPTTNSAYGSGDENNLCDETSELKPISTYARDKVVIEEELMQMPNSISFRLATVFGMSPRMRLDLLVNDFTNRALKDGFIVLFEQHFKRNYIHVKDVCNVFIHGLENHSTMRGEIYNVGLSSANLSKLELCQRIANHIPNFSIMSSDIKSDPDQRNYVVSNHKIETTGFSPRMSLDDGLKELIKGLPMLKEGKFTNV